MATPVILMGGSNTVLLGCQVACAHSCLPSADVEDDIGAICAAVDFQVVRKGRKDLLHELVRALWLPSDAHAARHEGVVGPTSSLRFAVNTAVVLELRVDQVVLAVVALDVVAAPAGLCLVVVPRSLARGLCDPLEQEDAAIRRTGPRRVADAVAAHTVAVEGAARRCTGAC